MDLTASLHELFGFTEFRPGQREACEAALAGRDVLVVMPTGSGKSLCYQLPGLLRDDLTVVVSPLVALMQDQVDALRARGLGERVALVNAQQDAGANSAALERALAGELRLLYVAPERFAAPGFLERMGTARVGLFVVDEAHCVSQWGHDFRPDYFRLADAARALGAGSIVASTATATPRVAADVVARLKLREPLRVATGFDRPNLAFGVARPGGHEKRSLLVECLRGEDALPAIVYTGTRAGAEEAAAELSEALGEPAVPYHAGLERERRAEVQRSFLADRVRIICATNAFGMGVDKPNVRTVVHATVPSSLEAYYQEAGRAGRDGLQSQCVLLANPQDKGLHVFFINQTEDPEAKSQRWAQYRAVWGYVDGEACRRAAILRHFGDRTTPHSDGRCCDVCDGPLGVAAVPPKRAVVTGDGDARTAIIAVVDAASPAVGRTRCVEILRGGRSKVVLKYGYDELPGYGELGDWRADDLLAEVDAMIAAGSLESTGGRFPKLVVSEAEAA